jgi:hypothetical protein
MNESFSLVQLVSFLLGADFFFSLFSVMDQEKASVENEIHLTPPSFLFSNETELLDSTTFMLPESTNGRMLPQLHILKGPPQTHRIVSLMHIPLKSSDEKKKSYKKWTKDEDEELKKLFSIHGAEKWSTIAELMTTSRSNKQCRERWAHHLSTDVKKCKHWSAEEEQIMIDIHGEDGNCWSKMSQKLVNRTPYMIKNHFYSTKTRAKLAFTKNHLNTMTAKHDESTLLFDYCFQLVLAEYKRQKKRNQPLKHSRERKRRKTNSE